MLNRERLGATLSKIYSKTPTNRIVRDLVNWFIIILEKKDPTDHDWERWLVAGFVGMARDSFHEKWRVSPLEFAFSFPEMQEFRKPIENIFKRLEKHGGPRRASLVKEFFILKGTLSASK